MDALFDFLMEVDQLKSVYRRAYVHDESKFTRKNKASSYLRNMRISPFHETILFCLP